jgi:hypothetical protein
MDWQALADEATRIVASTGSRGVALRVVGSLGIRLHCAAVAPYMDRFGRQPKDIDLVVAREGRRVMRQVLEEAGYQADRDLLVAMEGRRYTFAHPDRAIEVDVFVDRLDFCHVIEVRDRLREHPLTLPLPELLLSKLQVVEPTTTDLMDATAILLSHPVSPAGTDSGADRGADGGTERLSAATVAGVLARDWGFHHTAMRNLDRLAAHTAALDLTDDERGVVVGGIVALVAAVDATPKTLGWRLRARVGERVRWWQDVDEREATY